MGTYRFEFEAVGGHGCQRELKDGELVAGCQESNCPDCEIRRFVKSAQEKGSSVRVAKLIHWPGSADSVTDDLLTKIRSGSF
jgi:hypothetical protein